MLNIHLTLPVVVNLLRNAAYREPDRIGKAETGGCIYAINEGGVLTPVCIVGQMFADLGVLRLLLSNPSDMDNPAAHTAACTITSSFWDHLSNYGITADEDARLFAHVVQRKQDDDFPWGEAYGLAEQEYRSNEQRRLDDRLNNLFG